MRLFPDAEGLLCTLVSASLQPHSTTPLYSQFFTVSLHLRTFPGRWTSLANTGKKKGDIKDVRHFDNHFKAFIAFCPLARLSLGFWDFFDVENFQERILLTLEPVFRPSYPTHSPPLYLVCIYSPSMLCLRLQLYSFVFNRSLATCVSPCLYLTILSGIQGMGTEGGGGVCGGRVA